MSGVLFGRHLVVAMWQQQLFRSPVLIPHRAIRFTIDVLGVEQAVVGLFPGFVTCQRFQILRFENLSWLLYLPTILLSGDYMLEVNPRSLHLPGSERNRRLSLRSRLVSLSMDNFKILFENHLTKMILQQLQYRQIG